MILLLVFIALLILYGFLLNRNFYWLKLGVHQGDPVVFLGDSWPLFFQKLDAASYVLKMYNMLGKDFRYYGLYSGLSPKLVICDPELIKSVLVKDFDHFMDHAPMVDPKADPLFGANLLSLEGDEWKHMRSTLAPSFTPSKLQGIFPTMCEVAKKFTEYFKEQNKDLVAFEAKEMFTRYGVDVIASSAFGIQVDSLRNKHNEFYQMSTEIINTSFARFLRMKLLQVSPDIFRFFRMKIFSRKLDDFFKSIVQETIEKREDENISRPDMLQIFIDLEKGVKGDEVQQNGIPNHTSPSSSSTPHNNGAGHKKDGRKFTYQEIAAQAAIFFFAGFDSVSSTIAFGAYELADNKDVQDKLREEILRTKKLCGDGEITYDLLGQMKYMDMFLFEVLRKWPPFVVVGRKCTKEYTIKRADPTEKDVIVPAGMPVQIPVYGIHHNPKYYPEPEKFNPNRFDGTTKLSTSPCTYLPFGYGPRNCLGSRFAMIEIKILFYYILSNFELQTLDQTQKPLKLCKGLNINISPESGLWLGLKRI